MLLSHLPAFLSAWFIAAGAILDRRSALRLPLLLLGVLLAKGRRTVTSWFRAAGITTDFRRFYNVLWAVGRRASVVAAGCFCRVVKPLLLRGLRTFGNQDSRALIAQSKSLRYGPPMMLIDDADTQTKWYHRLKQEYARACTEKRPFVNPVQPRVLRFRS